MLDPSIKVVLAELIITITVTPDKPEGEAFGFFYYVKSTCGVYQCGLESVDLRKIEINADYTFSQQNNWLIFSKIQSVPKNMGIQ